VGLYGIAKGLLSILLKIKGYKIHGLENLPGDGPVIIACNHISLWDPIIVGCALPRQVSFMAKEELFENPILGRIVSGLGAFPVKRGQGDISAIRKSIGVLKDGNVLGIFPEGTRSKSGDIQEAMAGIALIMEKSQAPILPVKVYGSKGLLKQKKGNIGITVGKPIYSQKLPVPPDVENRRIWLANEIMKAVSQIE
jgi:1-acyl-sn-glycerol-3-phosphate acyltransferase